MDTRIHEHMIVITRALCSYNNLHKYCFQVAQFEEECQVLSQDRRVTPDKIES
jgi:hypothetical protein